MSLGQLWGAVLWTGLALAVLLSVFYLRRILRDRYFALGREEGRSDAMNELLLLRARLERDAEERRSAGEGDEEIGGESS
jgi:hypothetical protein